MVRLKSNRFIQFDQVKDFFPSAAMEGGGNAAPWPETSLRFCFAVAVVVTDAIGAIDSVLCIADMADV